MPINVVSHGILTSIQDLGRPGYYHLGIPIGGQWTAWRCARQTS